MTAAGARLDRPLFLPGEASTLFAVVSEPAGVPRSEGVIVLSGGGAVGCSGLNRLNVAVCRRLADLGWPAVRFDYRGVGDSTGTAERFRLDEPFVDDVKAISTLMQRYGVPGFAAVGSCFGARTALASAAESSDIVGLVLCSVPVRDFEMGEAVAIRLARKLTIQQQIGRAVQPRVLRGLMKRGMRRRYLRVARAKARNLLRRLTGDVPEDLRWVSERFLRELDAVVTRGIPVLFVYGAEDDFYEDFQAAARGRLGAILRRAEDRARVEVVDGSLHSSPSLRTQEACIDGIVRWFEDRAFADVEVSP